MNRIGGCLLVGAALAPLLAGCGQSVQDPNRPQTVEVTGTVTYNGSPVEGATITFNPATRTAESRGAVGKTDDSGSYQLTTFEAADGAIPASYTVTVAKTETQGALSEEEVNKYYERGETPPKPETKDLLPAKYKTPAESGLTADVTEGGDNVFDFELTD